MKSSRSTIALGILVAALLVWWVVRSRQPSPPPGPTTASVSTSSVSPMPSQPATATNPGSDTGTTVTPTPAPAAQVRPVPSLAAVPSASPNGSASAVANTTAASTDSASINAIKVRRMITDYHTLTGENPVGTNAEIMAATMGKNPRQAVLGPPDGLSLNSKGELIDEWGTPYFFHQLSRDIMEIHSAGPDKIMGTADDVIVR